MDGHPAHHDLCMGSRKPEKDIRQGDAGPARWSAPPRRLRLKPREVHVWRAPLDVDDGTVARLRETLAPDERSRASRLRREVGAKRFLVARAVLRAILARYAGSSPESLAFRYTRNGKPELASHGRRAPIAFSVAHSGDRALFAVTAGPAIGVDIERVRRKLDFEEIVRRHFSTAEIKTLRGLPDDRRREAFFVYWTRKEAVLKATGEGLTYPLDRVEVPWLPGKPPASIRSGIHPPGAPRWTIVDLRPYAGFVGALAFPGRRMELRRYSYRHSPRSCPRGPEIR
ncbi:MAG: 4'-phosphopantetheinyl transferase superfamily protein [Elusimicrobiota bacterium]